MYPEIQYKKEQDAITICGWNKENPVVVIPETIEGLPVKRIGDYGFAETAIEKISLPDTVSEIGRYAFYRCMQLRKLSFSDNLSEIASGAFTRCQLKKIYIRCTHGRQTNLKKILEEQRFELDVYITYCIPGEKQENAHLIFPEHYEEAVENTPARIVMTHYHGSGGEYRQCVYNKSIDYGEYDSLFGKAKAQENKETAIRISIARLTMPYALGDRARKEYGRFLCENVRTVIQYLLHQEDTDSLNVILNTKIWEEEQINEALDVAAEYENPAFNAVLMNEKGKENRVSRKKTFEL